MDTESTDRLTWKLRDYARTRGISDTQMVSEAIAKVAEEAGEAIGAWFAASGQNPRKANHGFSRDHVISELCDVIVTAVVAIGMVQMTSDPTVRHESAFLRSKPWAALVSSHVRAMLHRLEEGE